MLCDVICSTPWRVSWHYAFAFRINDTLAPHSWHTGRVTRVSVGFRLYCVWFWLSRVGSLCGWNWILPPILFANTCPFQCINVSHCLGRFLSYDIDCYTTLLVVHGLYAIQSMCRKHMGTFRVDEQDLLAAHRVTLRCTPNPADAESIERALRSCGWGIVSVDGVLTWIAHYKPSKSMI